jgi:uncharacterized protein YdhG (YjbR/CyaY superfamily)
MAKTGVTSVDDYIRAQPAEQRRVLASVRRTIRKALPGSEEVISYQIPAFKLNGRIVLYCAAWKSHYSLYPSSDRLVAAFRTELAPYEIGKGTIRFPLSEPVPATLIERIARFRAGEVSEGRTWKAARARKPKPPAKRSKPT